MNHVTSHRMALRATGRRKVSMVTAWVATAGVVLTGALGAVLASTTATAQASMTSSNSSPGSSNSNGSASSGGQLQTPAQPPGTGFPGRSHAGSGAS